MIVQAGLCRAMFARKAAACGKECLVFSKRDHSAGNVCNKIITGIYVHKYGVHIFRTKDKKVREYILHFAAFNRFTDFLVTNYDSVLYPRPFSIYTFNKMWGVVIQEEAAAKIEEQRKAADITAPQNHEDQAISLVSIDIYEKLIKGYIQKQWGVYAKTCRHLLSNDSLSVSLSLAIT